MFTQCLSVLLKDAPSLGVISKALNDYNIVETQASPDKHWALTGSFIKLAYRPELGGFIQVDVVDRKWPGLADFESGIADKDFLGSWAMSCFGPFTYPDSLESAAEGALSWGEADETVAQHCAFIRVRIGYFQDGKPYVPSDCDAVAELNFLMQLILKLLQLPGALCYFNPAGQILYPFEVVDNYLQSEPEEYPLELWSNIRYVQLDKQWILMDSVGNQQMNVSDNEAIFPRGMYKPGDVHMLIRGATEYLLEKQALKDGDSTEGPGGVDWSVTAVDAPLLPPRRPVILWKPEDGTEPPPKFTTSRTEVHE
jgi:hypothetical protein